jgi:RNA polymerase sigma-70 factor (ECF subfamily)
MKGEYLIMTDEMILDLYWERSEAAISETSKKYGRYCYSIAYNILHNNEDSEECTSDTYMKVWESVPPNRPTVFRAFLGKITRNLSLNKYKEQRTIKRGGGEIPLLLSELNDSVPSSSSVEDELEMKELVNAINDFLSTMDVINRSVFLRRYFYVDSIEKIAKHFKMSESKIKSMLLRTRKSLKAYLEGV